MEESMTNEVKLNLGCGDKILPGYINVDVASERAGNKPDVICDVRKLDKFADNYADEIMAVHVVEHFWRWEVVEILSEWVRVLKPGGKIRCSTPDLRFLIDLHQNPSKEINDRYIKWAVDQCWKNQIYLPGMVFNNFVN
jgi:predicted SAM-dependent methyltransferase